MFLRESDRRSYGMCRYSVSLITAGACNASFSECSMCPLCSSMRATPLKIITTARRSVHTLMGSKEAFRTSTRRFIEIVILREPGGGCQKIGLSGRVLIGRFSLCSLCGPLCLCGEKPSERLITETKRVLPKLIRRLHQRAQV